MRFLNCMVVVFLGLVTLLACGRSSPSESSVQSAETEETARRRERDRCEAKKLSCEVAVSALQQRVNTTEPTSPRFDMLMQQMLDKQMECIAIAANCPSPQ